MVGAGLAGRDQRAILPVIVIALTFSFLLLAFYFAGVQNVWIDESTQLLGSALPLRRMIAWLAGRPEPLGVPADRMPPLSYLIDWSWGHFGGSAPYGFRLLHLVFAGAGVASAILLAGRRYGEVAALVTGMLLVASPGLLTVGVEIRAYPLFFTATVLQLWLLHGLFTDGLTRVRLIGFAGAGLLAVYVHFFGLISSSALFVGLIVARARSRGDVVRIGMSWGALLLLSAGIAPFVGGARSISDDAIAQADPADALIAYLPRIYGHAAMLLHPVFAAILFAAIGALLVVATWRAAAASRARPWREPAGFEVVLIVALAAGLAVTVAAGFVVRGFDPMKPSYSIWMVPLVTVLVGAACAPGGRIARVATVIALLAVVALLPITVAFARHAPWFVHGPEGAISAEIAGSPSESAIVFVDGGWAYGYFPLMRRFGHALPQYLLDADGRLHPLTDADPTTPPVPQAVLEGRRQVLLVSIEPHTGGDLRALIEGAGDTALFAPVQADIAGWHRASSLVRPGLYWLRLARLERN